MIISHNHKFIFMHVRKVAGSSMKVAIAPHLVGDDIVIGSLDEILAAGGSLTPGMKKMLSRPASIAFAVGARMFGKTWPEAQNIAFKRNISRALGPDPPHPTAEDAAKFVGDAWSEYTKFCFVRNPWTRVVSDYNWHKRSSGREFEFEAYLETLGSSRRRSPFVHAGNTSSWDMMAVGGKLAMDRVGRFENITEDFRNITEKIGLPPLTLTAAEKVAKITPDYEALFTKKCRSLVTELFAQEFEIFDYRWPF